MSTPAVPTGLAACIGAVQFFFVTTWTLYVIYLPGLAQQAGIAKQWVPWILVADQLLFAIMDVATGFWVDRVRSGLARFGGWILAVSALSCAAFVLLPFVSSAGAGLMLALIVVWAVTSSVLRSPPWALLSRYAAKTEVPWLSALVLTGSALAAAVAPYRREGAMLGALFAVFALATFARIGAGATGLTASTDLKVLLPWLPVVFWAAAAGLAIVAGRSIIQGSRRE